MKEMIMAYFYNVYDSKPIYHKEIPVSLIPDEGKWVVIKEEGRPWRVSKVTFVYEPLNSVRIDINQ